MYIIIFGLFNEILRFNEVGKLLCYCIYLPLLALLSPILLLQPPMPLPLPQFKILLPKLARSLCYMSILLVMINENFWGG